MRNNKILVIAGMHRSGTSLISQWLYQCGLNLGETLVGASVGNTEGHFEDTDFLSFHEETLEAQHLSKLGLINEPVTKLSLYQRAKLKGIIGFKNEVNEEWGWKDPRTCLFLDHYRAIIPDAHYLVIIRDFNATVTSLIRRDIRFIDFAYLSKNWFSRTVWKKLRRQRTQEKLFKEKCEFYLKVWIGYNEVLLKHIQSLSTDKFIVTDANMLCDVNTTIFDKLVNNWHFSLKYADFKKVYKETLLGEAIVIEPFITDKYLLEKAESLQNELRKYL